MARPIGYDPDVVLQEAMQVFWEKGYDMTSIQDIVAVTGLKPGSLYNLYGSKEGLFEAVLDLYATEALKVAKEVLLEGDDGLKNIETFLHDVVLSSIINEKTNGCLMVKTLLIVSHKDSKIQSYITKVFEEVERYIVLVLQTCKDKGQISVNPEDFARFIIITMYGAHVYYKTSKDKDALTNSLQIVLDMLVQ